MGMPCVPGRPGVATAVDASGSTSSSFMRHVVDNAEVLRLDHPVFFVYSDRIMRSKYLGVRCCLSNSDQSGVLRGTWAATRRC